MSIVDPTQNTQQCKTCIKCRSSKPLDEFNRKTKAVDGRQQVCRECSRGYYARMVLHGAVKPVNELPPFPQLNGVDFGVIPSLDGYAADSLGRIWSCRKYGIVGGNTTEWKLKDAFIINSGYLVVHVTNRDGKKVTKLVHRLVLEAFAGMPGEDQEGMHLDHDRMNCRPSNLAWGTHKENIHHSIETGKSICRPGEQNPMAKITRDTVLQVRQLATTMTQADVARCVGLEPNHVYLIVNRKRWGHI